LDLVLTNIPVDMAVGVAEKPLLKLDRHHKASDIEMLICCCKFEAMEDGVKRYKFKLVDCAAIVDELDAGAAFFRVEGLTNAWTYSTRWSGAALKDECLRKNQKLAKNGV
jgi:hypothetical protein